MTMKNFLLLLSAAAICGCAMPQPGSSPYGGLGMKRTLAPKPQPQAATQSYVVETVEIVTEPPGAVIHVNGASAGNSPIPAAPVLRYWRGPAGAMLLDTVKIEAFPTAAGQCVQSVLLGQNNTKVSSPVRLVMTNCAPVPGK